MPQPSHKSFQMDFAMDCTSSSTCEYVSAHCQRVRVRVRGGGVSQKQNISPKESEDEPTGEGVAVPTKEQYQIIKVTLVRSRYTSRQQE